MNISLHLSIFKYISLHLSIVKYIYLHFSIVWYTLASPSTFKNSLARYIYSHLALLRTFTYIPASLELNIHFSIVRYTYLHFSTVGYTYLDFSIVRYINNILASSGTITYISVCLVTNIYILHSMIGIFPCILCIIIH